MNSDFSNPILREYPLLLPDGIMMKPEEFLASKYSSVDVDDDLEEIIHLKERIVVNKGKIEEINELELSDPELFVRTLLEDLIEVLSSENPMYITYYDALTVSYDPRVRLIFYKTRMFRLIDLKKLKSPEQTTCFLVNLTNLLWIHAHLTLSEDLSRALLYKNWGLRHIHYNMVGYKVGSLNFVSLYDLHSNLLHYPEVLRTKTLNSLTYLEDSRIHSVLCQPYIFSPVATVIEPVDLSLQLNNLLMQYLKTYIIVDLEMDLILPVPLLIQLERMSYVQITESEYFKNEDGIPEKLYVLIDVLQERGFPYYDLLKKDVYMANLTEFRLYFQYSVFYVERRNTIPKTIYKCCRFHKSLYECLNHHVSLVRSTLAEEHLVLKSTCGCTIKDGVCINNVLCKMTELYGPMLNDFKVALDFENSGLRCMYAAVSFAVGIRKKKNRPYVSMDDKYEFLSMLKIVQSVYLNLPTPLICRKISICAKIFVITNEIYEKWPTWYSLYIGDPDEILEFIVEHENIALATEWVTAQQAIVPGYTFALPIFSKFIQMLSSLEIGQVLQRGLNCANDISIAQMCDYLMKNDFMLSRLLFLIPYLLSSTFLSDTEKLRYYPIELGLRLLNVIPIGEHTYFIDIVSQPILMVEQLILNRKITLLKVILKEYSEVLETFPENIKELDTVSKAEIDEMLREYATKALHFCRKPSNKTCLNTALLHAELFKEGYFYPPDDIPPKHMWIPNNWVSNCMCCKNATFSVFIRRHHCRRCARVVCGQCSTKKMKVAIYKGQVRVCDHCFTFENQNESQDDTGSEHSSIGDDNSRKLRWKLTPNEDLNTLVRRQAVFETAPDTELCLSILELHTESITVPRVLYSNAENLMRILRQRLVNRVNVTNFDYNEISSIVRSLLTAGKIYYTHLNESGGAKRCEELCSEVDILNQLSKIKFFPNDAAKPIKNVEELKKIRDVVLERQQWDLALEISTKIGLECNSIWYLWGMDLLKSGKWSEAREKFSKSSLKKNSAPLNDIMDLLYSNVRRESSTSFYDRFRFGSKSTVIPNYVIEECLYYLKNYGSPKQLFDFYLKIDRLHDMLKVLNEKKLPVKLFKEHVFIPYLSSKRLNQLLSTMHGIDRSLLSWKNHINEMCIYCNKNGDFNELYQIQLWMGDYYRAAISCTKFYVANVTCYTQLNKNSEHLVNAVVHLKKCLDNKDNKLVEKINENLIQKLINVVQMQMEVCKLLNTSSASSNAKFSKVPTLLGGDDEKQSICVLIFETHKDFNHCFQLVQRLVIRYCSNPINVYSYMATEFMKHKTEKYILLMIESLKKSGKDFSKEIDKVVVSAIKAEAKELKTLINYISDINTKIEMCIESGWLKSAYVMAVRTDKLEYIEIIKNKAETMDMKQISVICEKKLSLMKTSETENL